MLAIVFAILIAILIAWLVVVVPIQYFVYLVCGVPGRIVAASNHRVVAGFANDTKLEICVLRPGGALPNVWWVARIASKPVAATGVFASLFFVLLNRPFSNRLF